MYTLMVYKGDGLRSKPYRTNNSYDYLSVLAQGFPPSYIWTINPC